MLHKIIVVTFENTIPRVCLQDCYLFCKHESYPFTLYEPSQSDLDSGIIVANAYSTYYQQWYRKNIFFYNPPGKVMAKLCISNQSDFYAQQIRNEMFDTLRLLSESASEAIDALDAF